jgi:glycosyltransferase involved in cell wall biosynthesis
MEIPCAVTIIVPTRNRPGLLARALAAIHAQSLPAFEVIVVDDASSDETRSAYDALWSQLDSRFRLIQLGNAGGVGAGPSVTRNTGIAAAHGQIITFCDDDDFWTSDRHLVSMVEVFSQHPEVDMYIANQQAVSCEGKVEREDWLPGLVRATRGKAAGPHGHLVSMDDLVRSGGFAQLNILAVRKQLALDIGCFWTRTTYEEDRDFFWRAADAARAVFFNPERVAQHNIPDPAGRNNLSRSFSQAERWLLSALVSQHIAMSVRHGAIRKLCHAYEGDILRRLSEHWCQQGKHALGLQYARRALAARGSLKWALYTGLLTCRQLGRREVA